MRIFLAATLACAIPFAVQAQDTAQAIATPAPVDQARIPVAERVAGRLLPPGAFATMMRTTMDQLYGNLLDQAMNQMSLSDIAKMAGASEEKVATLAAVNLKQVMEIVDPAYQERSRLTMNAMADEMVIIMTDLEPEYRAGLAEALAARFPLAQLQELDRFFATPAGSAYASQSMTLYVDPAMMRRMNAIMPRVMQSMPAMMQKAMAATAHLPKQADFKNLSSDQKARLAALFGEENQK